MEKMVWVEIYENGYRHDVHVTLEKLEEIKANKYIKILSIEA